MDKLQKEFPQYSEKIEEKKSSDNHFKKIFDEYQHIDKQIHGIESTSIFTDEELNEMRVKRLKLKDQLIGIIEEKPIKS